MPFIHHPDLGVEREVPDDTVDIWCGDPGWRPGTLEDPEPWPPADQADPDEPSTDLGEPAESTVPAGDTTFTPSEED